MAGGGLLRWVCGGGVCSFFLKEKKKSELWQVGCGGGSGWWVAVTGGREGDREKERERRRINKINKYYLNGVV